MPAWKKVIVSGSDASLKTLQVSNSVTASIISASQFSGSLFGTASFSRNSVSASYVRNLYITASSTAPVSPTDNELWYDADNGKTYIRYNDGTSTQWVLQSDPTIDVNTSLQTLQEVTDLGTTTTHAISITNTTNATDSASGAFIVDGGAGFGLDVWARKFYGDGSALTGVVAASIVEVDTLQTVTTRGTNTSASIFITNTTNATSGGAGALRVSGGLYVGENIWAKSITSSLEGTASWARNSNSASFVTGSIFTAGNLALSSSFSTTSSFSITSSFSKTASFVEFDNVANKPTLFSGSSQVQLSGITGTTFADTLYTFPGDVVVQGNVTAEQLIVSSSVYFVTTSFSSGSTIFGNDTTDNHRFTGSLFVTGAAFISGQTQVTGSFRVLGGITATSLTGSITASSLQGDIILGTQTSGSFVATLTQGTGVTITGLTAEGSNPTISIGQAVGTTSNVQFASITASVVSSSNGFTGSLSGTSSWASNVVGGYVISVAGTANEILVNGNTTAANGAVTLSLPSSVDLGAVSSFTATSLTGSITASSLQGAILNTQLQNSSVTVGSTAISLGGSATTIAGIISLTSTNVTSSIISASNFISGGQIVAVTGFTGSISASGLKGAILNTQLQNSSVTVGSTNISLGGTATTIAGLTSLTSTGLTGSITASSLQGAILNSQLQNSSVTVGTTAISLGGSATTITGIASLTTTNETSSIISASNHISGGQIIAATGFTGSISASGLKGAILNSQLQNSSVTIGNTNVSLGGTATTITGLTSVTSTNFVGTASYVTGSIFTSTNQALSSSYALTASFALNAGGGVGFPFSGSAQITGSLGVTGSISATGALTASLRQGYIWVGGSGNVTTLVPTSSLGAGGASGANAKLNQSVAATTWSFGHFLGEIYPNITVFDSNGEVIIPGRIETVDANNLNVYFDTATAGTVVASVGGIATTINAQSASYFSGTELTVSTAVFTPAVTSSLGATTTTVSRVWTGSFSGAFWDYVVNNGINYRGGTVMGVWNKIGSAQFTDTSTPDIGDTSQLTFGVVINGEYAELRATTSTSGWNVKTFVRKI